MSSGKSPAGRRSHESTDDLPAVIDRGDAGGQGARKIREGCESAVVQQEVVLDSTRVRIRANDLPAIIDSLG